MRRGSRVLVGLQATLLTKAESGSECRVRSRLETVSIQLVESIRVSLVLSEGQLESVIVCECVSVSVSVSEYVPRQPRPYMRGAEIGGDEEEEGMRG
jgi:hypothetical protein